MMSTPSQPFKRPAHRPRGPPATSRSAASPSIDPADEARDPGSGPAPQSSSLSSSRPAAISVAMTKVAIASCRPHCRSDRERQVGAGAEAGGSDRRRHHQRRQRASLSRPADPVGRAQSRRIGRGPSICLMACSTVPAMLGRRLGANGQGRNRPAACGRAGCRSWSAAPGFTFEPCSTASRPFPPSIPPSAPQVRAASVAENLAALAPLDPVAAATLNPGDTTRIARALEVVRSTGKTLGRMAAAARRRDRRNDRSSGARPAPAPPLALRALRPALRSK